MHPSAAAGSLERSVAVQQLQRSLLHGGQDGGGDIDGIPVPGPGSKLQQLSLAAPPGGRGPEDAGSSRHRGGDATPTQAELDAAWDENASLAAQNAALDAKLMELEGRADASVLHMAQMRRVVAELKANKEAFALAPDASISAAVVAIRSLGADKLGCHPDVAPAAIAAAAAADPHNAKGAPLPQRSRSGKRRCSRPESEKPAAGGPVDETKLAEKATEARAAAALSVSGGDPAQALIHLLDLYVRLKTSDSEATMA